MSTRRNSDQTERVQDPGTRGLEGRMIRAETELRTAVGDIIAAREQLAALGTRVGIEVDRLGGNVDTRLRAMQAEYVEARRPNWQLYISAVFLMMAIFSAALVPVYQAASYARDAANQALGWQREYVGGRIPSSAEPELASIKEKFAEVETQFRAFKERMIENEGLMKERSDRNYEDIRQLRDLLAATRERVVQFAGAALK